MKMYKTSCLSLLALAAFASSTAAVSAPPLVVTEVSPSNKGLVRDEDGDSPDWIEVFNAGADPVALSRYALTDDPDNPRKWGFPDRILESGEFLIVMASGKDRASREYLHANFRLKAKGEYLGLSEDGRIVQAFEEGFSELEPDFSYGVVFRGDEVRRGQIGPLAKATPGLPNVDRLADPLTADTKFSVDRGFYREPIEVVVSSATPGARMRYTLDGSTPTETHGLLYEQPLELTTTTTLRAVAFAEGHRPSDVDTHTYVFPAAVLRQPRHPEGWPRTRPVTGGRQRGFFGFGGGGSVPMDYEMAAADSFGASDSELLAALEAIPSMSIVTDQANLLDPQRGIYARPSARGRDWERPVSIELIDPTGEEKGFQWNAGLRIRGGHSRQPWCAKHAFRVYFRDVYGDGPLRYPLFGSEGVKEFEDVDLRTAQNYSYHYSDDGAYNTMIREVFARDSQRDLGQPYARSRYYHLYLNGLYWGIYQSQEHTEASYAERYFGADEDRYDVMKARVAGRGMGATDGTREAWDHLYQEANAIAAEADPQLRLLRYRALQGLDAEGRPDGEKTVYLDAENLIDYMLVIFFTGGFDGPVSRFMRDQGGNNWFAIFQREGRLGFQFFCHDNEHSLGVKWGPHLNRVGPFPAGQRESSANPQWIHQQLTSVDAYRRKFQERAEWALLGEDGPLRLSACLQRVERRAQVLEKAIVAECARWGDYKQRPGYSKADWQRAVDHLREVLRIRAEVVPDQLRTAQRFSGGDPRQGLEAAPLFSPIPVPVMHWTDEGKRAGYFELGEVEGKVFYTMDGSDPQGRTPSVREAVPSLMAEVPLLRPGRMIRAFVPEDNALRGAWRELEFDDREWRAGIGGAGYDLRRDYRSLIGVDMSEEMVGRRTALLTRSLFRWDGEPLDGLTLKLKFEDGFVAYLNGEEVASYNAPQDRREMTAAVGQHEDSLAMQWKSFDLSRFRSALRVGDNVLAIQGLNDQVSSSDLLIYPQLVGWRRQQGTAIDVSEETRALRARALVGDEWGPMKVVPIITGSDDEEAAEAAKYGNLIISEIMYHPGEPTEEEQTDGLDDADLFEFVELMNLSDKTVDLAGAAFTNGITVEFNEGNVLPPGERGVVVKHRGAFEKRYGSAARVLGIYEGGLKNSGEKLTLEDGEGEIISEVSFKDSAPWPQSADGLGSSLVLKDPSSNPSLNLASEWAASSERGGSPGKGDGAAETGVLINEILTHTDLPDVDAVELYNPTEKGIDVSGWYLTDDPSEPSKYRLVEGSEVPAGGYLVVKGDNDDDPSNNANLPANRFARAFSLSSHGESIHLFAPDANGQTRHVHGFEFIAGENGVSFGRHVNSEGKEQFPPQSRVTLGEKNAGPRKPLVVISEIFYHPDESDEDEEGEFVEIWNWSRQSVPLFDPLNPGNTWQISGIGYGFPTDQTLKPGEVAVISRMDPETFRRRHRLPAELKIFGPLEDVKISNSGERLRLLRPDLPDVEEGVVPMLQVDSVRYNDRDPWPEEADGGGVSLERDPEAEYSDDPKAWRASEQNDGTPGVAPAAS